MANPWILTLHPRQAESIVNILKTELPDVSLNIITRYPRLLEYDPDDLLTVISYFNLYKITNRMIETTPQVFKLTSNEIKRRIENLLDNPFTLVFKKHRQFLLLVINFHIILPRLRFLEENNYKFATIYSLTTFHSYAEQ